MDVFPAATTIRADQELLRVLPGPHRLFRRWRESRAAARPVLRWLDNDRRRRPVQGRAGVDALLLVGCFDFFPLRVEIGTEDLDLIECHDASAPAELAYYEEFGLCKVGDGGALIDSHEAGVGAALQQAFASGHVRRDELFVQTKFTPLGGQDPNRIPYDPQAPIEKQVANPVLIKLNKIGTLSQNLDAIDLAHDDWKSHDRARALASDAGETARYVDKLTALAKKLRLRRRRAVSGPSPMQRAESPASPSADAMRLLSNGISLPSRRRMRLGRWATCGAGLDILAGSISGKCTRCSSTPWPSHKILGEVPLTWVNKAAAR